jgi:hypothetical protein
MVHGRLVLEYGGDAIGGLNDFVFWNFTVEMCEFCPDSVDQGIGNVKELKKTIKQTKNKKKCQNLSISVLF